MSVNLVLQHAQIGPLIRQHRKSFKITANAAADTARILRVTLHGIERSEHGRLLKCNTRSRSASSPGAKIKVMSSLRLIETNWVWYLSESR